MTKEKTPEIIKEPNCLNCGFPFQGYEIFCPECGQKNKKDALTFKNFMSEIFKGFTSWDAKFWKTLFPLLTQPGKVSKDFIEGKRARYTNPFRFYLTVTVIFFLILGSVETYKDYNNLNSNTSIISFGQTERDSIHNNVINNIEKTEKEIDSIKTSIFKNDSLNFEEKTIETKPLNNIQLIGKFIKFQKKNPTVGVDKALTKLKAEKNTYNRFWYSKSKTINSFISDNEESKKFSNHIISKLSISLFILLPIFTLFLKLIYSFRKNTITYIEHLIFVFHIQTVFFLLLIIQTLTHLAIGGKAKNYIFLISFLLYLYLAMYNFYKEGKLKTFFKFCMINSIFIVLLGITILATMLIGFVFY